MEGFMFIRLLADGGIILAEKQRFEEEKHLYEDLKRNLGREWLLLCDIPATERRAVFELGEHVLIKSEVCQGPRRAVIQDITSCRAWQGKEKCTYRAYVYDEGVIEEVPQSLVRVLNKTMKTELEPRTVMVRLNEDVHKVSELEEPDEPARFYMSDYKCSDETSKMVIEWLTADNIKYLGIKSMKRRSYGIIYGDVYRKLCSSSSETREESEEEKFLLLYLKSMDMDFDHQIEKFQNMIRVLKERSAQAASSSRVEEDNYEEDEDMEQDTADNHEEDEDMEQDTADNHEKDEDMEQVAADNHSAVIASSSQSSSLALWVGESVLNKSRVDMVRDKPPQSNPTETNPRIIKPVQKSSGLQDNNEQTKSVVVNLAADRYTRETFNIPGRLLVRGKWARPPYASREEFLIPEAVLKAMETLAIEELSSLHKIVAPNFKRGCDLVIIAPDARCKRGKTMRALSYLLPIICLVYETYSTSSTVDENEPPETLIIVNSYNTGKELETFINSLLNYTKDLPMRVKFLSRDHPPNKHINYEKKMVPGGISILIMTMTYMNLVLQTNDGPFLFKKLRFLIFEEVDQYVCTYWDSIEAFIDALRINQYVSAESVPFQITFSGSKWKDEIEKLYKQMVDGQNRAPMVTISSPHQVLRYSKIKWKIHHVLSEEERLQTLQDLNKSVSSCHGKIVLVCSSPDIAQEVYESIKPMFGWQEVDLVTSRTKFIQQALGDIYRRWGNKDRSNFLIISDDMLFRVKIANATCLICYDSPTQDSRFGSRRSTADRFALLWDNIRLIEVNPATASPAPSSTSSASSSCSAIPSHENLIAHFLLSGDEHNFLETYKFASTLDNVDFPQFLRLLAKQMEETGEKKAPFCESMKVFGRCNIDSIYPGTCRSRHFFSRTELSAPSTVPYSGELEFRIVKCNNPSSYQVELLCHYEFLINKRVIHINYISEAKRRKKEMMIFYTKDENQHAKLDSFGPGTWCAVKSNDPDTGKDYFSRTTVERVVQHDKFGNPLAIRVFCVDTGLTLNPTVDRVFKLPNDFQSWPPLVVNLVLCNLSPCRNELEYRITVSNRAKHLLQGKIFNAKIWLSIGNTVWVNPMVEYYVDPDTGKHCKGQSVRLALIDDKLAEFNGHHLDDLMQLVNKFPGEYPGITSATGTLPIFSDELELAKKLFHQIGDEKQWAFIDKTTDTALHCAKIKCQYGLHPWQFFGTFVEFDAQKKDLEKELNDCVNAYIYGTGTEKRFRQRNEIFQNYFEPGMVVAAFEPDDKIWMRALIIAKDQDEINKFEVYFVDQGGSYIEFPMESLFPIPRKLVMQLPFQAIALSLCHVVPLDGSVEWDADGADAFLDIVFKDEVGIEMEVVVYDDFDLPGESTPSRYYKAIAFYQDEDIGATLVENGKAQWAGAAEKDNYVQHIKNRIIDTRNVAREDVVVEENDEGTESDDEEFRIDPGIADLVHYATHINPRDWLQFLGITPKNGYKIHIPEPEPDIVQLDAESETEAENDVIQPQPSTSQAEHDVIQPQPSTSQAEAYAASRAVAAPSLKTDFLSPRLIWRQTENDFIVTIELSDIKDFELNVLDDNKTIDFKTLDKQPNYGFTLQLYGKVDSEYKIHLTGMYMRVTLSKRLKGVKWPRALYDRTENFRWLKEDLAELLLSDDDEEQETSGLAYYRDGDPSDMQDELMHDLDDPCFGDDDDSDSD